ncbi:hypothetical protein CIHG_05190 [Coccidioides immitis H538.4]|uniref:Wax synthase domain-containing protein n=3 Tax=Coccidioides immitis TaxID=5501 RepID=A0A0J8TXA8_COCIT|nr:hypothetical protein CIRG_08262 [Coccidioides immitis RMSCC 2394]KMU78582.1 hypothetical protein CISG_01622 [Coccidioides immitis RMSCC 3703]KMU87396.1 hypothetical protein CIHG_05190 [Coccidioides immitis H538.4]
MATSSLALGGIIGLDSYTAFTSTIFMLILPSILFMQKHSLVAKPDNTPAAASSSSVILRPNRHTISAACRIWNNPRHLKFRQPGPGSTPWRSLLFFTLRSGLKVAAIVIIDRMLVKKIQAHLFANSNVLDFTPDQLPIIRPLLGIRIDEEDVDPISRHQFLLRAFISVSWIWANFVFLESCHAILAIFFVAILRLDNPEDWPSLFGNIADAWTVRRFWGRFWHRIATPTLSQWTRIIIQRVLHLQLTTGVAKTVEAFGIFFLSGLAHALASWRTGEGFAHLDILFFCANFVVVAVEILVARLWKYAVKGTWIELELRRNSKLRVVGRILGLVWVFSWFFWMVPRWLYPKALRLSIKQALMIESLMLNAKS